MGLMMTWSSTGCRQSVASAKDATTPSIDPRRELCLSDPGESKWGEVAELGKRLRVGPASPEDLVLLGEGWVRIARRSGDPGFYLHADACSKLALELVPSDRGARRIEALVALNQHQFESARSLAESILSQAPDDFAALGIRGDAELELGKYEAATLSVNRMLERRPDLGSYSRKAYLLWLENHPREAMEMMRLAVSAGLDPRDPEPTAWAFVQVAAFDFSGGRYESAEAVSTRALEWVPEYAPGLVARGRARLALGKGELAVEDLERALELRPLPEPAWLLGDAYEYLGDSAKAALAHARVETEGRRGDRLTLATFYAVKNKNLAEAQKIITEEMKTRGGIFVEDTLAWVLFRQGRLDEARAASDRAMALGTKEARLLYHAGAIRMARGDKTRGRALIVEALQRSPKFDWTDAQGATRLVGLPTKEASRER